jgi:hypothetical protein
MSRSFLNSGTLIVIIRSGGLLLKLNILFLKNYLLFLKILFLTLFSSPKQCCGSGSVSGLDTDSVGSLDPYPDPRGQKGLREIENSLQILAFEVLDVLL